MFDAITPDAIMSLAERVGRRYALNPDELEEMISEGLLRACKTAAKINTADNPAAFAYNLMKRAALNYIQQSARRPRWAHLDAADLPTRRTDPAEFVPDRIALATFLNLAGPKVQESLNRRMGGCHCEYNRRQVLTDSMRVSRARAKFSEALAPL